jgi:60 kDa SS-A/Ro ribonucleoprotein
MSSLNYAKNPRLNMTPLARTHNGLAVKPVSAENQLVRLTMAHMLWEKQFYVDGADSAKMLIDLTQKVNPAFVATVAKRAREQFKLRHVPLLLARGLAKRNALKAADLADIIQRPDETAEFLKLYWKDGKTPISNQVKKGLGNALLKFNEYQLAKWDKNSAEISLRDVMFLTHPKPQNPEQEALFKKLANQELATPDTWETELSAGKDKKETFERLMAEGKLGALAFLRNLRNMLQAGVSESSIRAHAQRVKLDRVLPFRFIAAARIVPQLSDMLEQMMFKCLETHDKLKGKTVILVDCSGSMFGVKVSEKSDLDRFDAAAALAVLCREICEEVEIFGFATSTVRVNSKLRGFALVEAIRASTSGGTDFRQAVNHVNGAVRAFDRCIMITDEQSSTAPGAIRSDKNYLLNVGSYQNGINHYDWLTITGFSEAVLDYVQMVEKTA